MKNWNILNTKEPKILFKTVGPVYKFILTSLGPVIRTIRIQSVSPGDLSKWDCLQTRTLQTQLNHRASVRTMNSGDLSVKIELRDTLDFFFKYNTLPEQVKRLMIYFMISLSLDLFKATAFIFFVLGFKRNASGRVHDL